MTTKRVICALVSTCIKNPIAMLGLGIILGGAAQSCTTQRELIHKINILMDYHQQAESLLDSLENEYNWVDQVDHEGYYDAQSKVKQLNK